MSDQLESEVWKPVHIERKKSGQIIDWFLFKVISPSGADNEYDYVTGQLYTDFGLVNSSARATDWMKAHPGGNPMAERTGELIIKELSIVIEVQPALGAIRDFPKMYQST